MQDNYNYYTSTHHSSSLKTFYVALNRLGAPRKTHIPTNKPLGKLSTYVRSITLVVPEHKGDALVARLFGANHVKHGLKHLCASARGLQDLAAKKMYVPSCGANGGRAKLQTAPVVRPKRPHSGPASLTERSHRRPAPSAAATTAKCTQEPCPKRKKKMGKNAAATSLAPDARSLIARTEPSSKSKETPIRHRKKVKHKPHKSRKHSPTPQTTTEATTTTTVAGVSVDENLIGDDDDDDGGDVPSTGPTAFSSDAADDDYGYDS